MIIVKIVIKLGLVVSSQHFIMYFFLQFYLYWYKICPTYKKNENYCHVLHFAMYANTKKILL